jgi:hypothetical protein
LSQDHVSWDTKKSSLKVRALMGKIYTVRIPVPAEPIEESITASRRAQGMNTVRLSVARLLRLFVSV